MVKNKNLQRVWHQCEEQKNAIEIERVTWHIHSNALRLSATPERSNGEGILEISKM
ncbi:hypothetical protein [Clostridium tagluense]|uniref:hypothetical protein n=1 Tax=Clostridium tagluense TaxID=360422 RepID=UPI001C6EA7E9|nr:hypothetical protein [Clostridium tagluense]MBW9158731.1 hypothetical protein [Clostridium tagluense]WLC67398.1 hypothetical protein KTC93_09565 [Clostridium tagluense]